MEQKRRRSSWKRHKQWLLFWQLMSGLLNAILMENALNKAVNYWSKVSLNSKI